MIFYFTGTGNSGWVAQKLAEELNDELRFIPKEWGSDKQYELKEGERLGFVFPCYSWGVPSFVEKFIEQMSATNVTYVYFVTTCGDDTGRTAEIFCRLISRKGWNCTYGCAVQMPESYVCLPGFDVDPKEKEQTKLTQAVTRINDIIDDIIDGRGGFDTLPGNYAWLKSSVIRPVFNTYLVTPRYFKTNSQCVGCGKCVQTCPFENVELGKSNTPQWGNNCVMCLRCYHTCPAHAIEWGKFTKNKGQYLFKK